MYSCCCSPRSEFMKERLEYQVEETEKGIRVDLVPKDPDKKKALQDLMKACREFCGSDVLSCC